MYVPVDSVSLSSLSLGLGLAYNVKSELSIISFVCCPLKLEGWISGI